MDQYNTDNYLAGAAFGAAATAKNSSQKIFF